MGKSLWWDNDIFKVTNTGEDLEVNYALSGIDDKYIKALVATRFLFAKYNMEPKSVTLELDPETFAAIKEKIASTVGGPWSSFSWGGFIFSVVFD